MGRQSRATMANVRAHVERAAKMLALEIAKRITMAMPVDTGHARANTVPSVGVPFTAIVDGGSMSAYQAGVAQVVAFKLGDGALFVSNNVEYVPRLNDGWSSQAPAGFIEAAVDQAIDMVRQHFVERRIVIDTVAGHGATMAANLASAYNPLGGD